MKSTYFLNCWACSCGLSSQCQSHSFYIYWLFSRRPRRVCNISLIPHIGPSLETVILAHNCMKEPNTVPSCRPSGGVWRPGPAAVVLQTTAWGYPFCWELLVESGVLWSGQSTVVCLLKRYLWCAVSSGKCAVSSVQWSVQCAGFRVHCSVRSGLAGLVHQRAPSPLLAGTTYCWSSHIGSVWRGLVSFGKQRWHLHKKRRQEVSCAYEIKKVSCRYNSRREGFLVGSVHCYDGCGLSC